MDCPICEKKGLDKGTVVCPQCDSDLSTYNLLSEITIFDKKQVRNNHYIYLLIIIVLLITGYLFYNSNSTYYKKIEVRNTELKDSLVIQDNYITSLKDKYIMKKEDINIFRYKVKSGDNLWFISKLFYGNGANYIRIKEINKLKSDNLYIGQIITIQDR